MKTKILTITCNPCNHGEWLTCLRRSDTKAIVIQAGAARFVVYRRKVLSSSGNPNINVWPVECELPMDVMMQCGRDEESEDRTLHDRLMEARCMTEEIRDDLTGDGTFRASHDEDGFYSGAERARYD